MPLTSVGDGVGMVLGEVNVDNSSPTIDGITKKRTIADTDPDQDTLFLVSHAPSLMQLDAAVLR